MRPEYIGIICGHQLINSRIKGKELAEGDVCQIFTEQQPLSARGRSRGRRELGQEGAAQPHASCNLNCLTLVTFPAASKSKGLNCCQAMAANETELSGGMFSVPSAVVEESEVRDGGLPTLR